MKTNCGIYRITNITNDKVYIGSSINLKSRKWNHFLELNKDKHINSYLQNSFNKYGENNFKWEIIEYVEKIEDKKLLKEKLLELEQKYLNEYIENEKINHEKCYNLSPTVGSCLGFKLSEESKQKISKARKGIKLSEETKEKLRQINIGKKHTVEDRLKQSEAQKGRVYTEEHNKKLSKANKGKKRSKEFKEELSKMKLDRIWIHKDEETKMIHKEDLCKWEKEGFIIGRGSKK